MKTFFDLVAQEDTLLVLDTSGNIIKEIPLDEFSEEIRESFNRIPTKIGYFDNDNLIPIRTPLMHCHTDGSQLDGAVTAKQLAKAADSVVAITDHGVMTETYGFYNACKSNGKIPVIGCEVYTENLIDGEKKANHMVLLCKNLQGYRNICEILSRAEMNFYRRPQVSLEMLEELHDGLIATSACMGGEIPRALMDGNLDRAEEVIDILQDIFGDDFYLEVQRHNVPGEDFVNRTLIDWAQSKGIGIIATPDSHYAREEDRLAHEVLLGIGTHKTLSDEKRFKFEGDNYHIPTAEEFEELWADVPLVWEGLYDICKKIDFDFVTGKLFMPNFPCPEGMTQDDYFCHLVDDGFKKRFPSFDSPEKEEEYKTRLAYEKETILKMGFSGYFLIVQDYIAYARSIGGFVGPGRGSAVGSLAAYCLGITNLDPIPYGLLFERFLNPERVSMPDIDTDFDVEVRDKVVQYCRDKYGDECVSKIITFGTLSARTVLRDVGRVMEVELTKMDRFAKAVPNEVHITLDKAMEKSAEFKKMAESDPELQRVLEVAKKLEGLKRHRSTHACGVVIGSNAIKTFLPEIQIMDKDTKTKARTTSFSGPELEDLGLLKMDFLGLRNMSVIRDVVAAVPSIARDGSVPLDDPYVYRLIGTGHTTGIFQIESGGMQNLMRQMFSDVAGRVAEVETKYKVKGYLDRMVGGTAESRKAANEEFSAIGKEMFERLIAAISLFRPGPMDYIPQYLEGMKDPSSIHYDCPELEPILSRTYGVLVYQEQVQQTCRTLAGYSLGRADLIRRAMGKKKMEIMNAEKEVFLYGNAATRKEGEALVPGCLANGISEEAALTIWDKMVEFAKYAFNKSHSAGYAVISATTAWMKLYYGAEFEVANMNSLLGKAEDIQSHLNESRHLGIKVLGPDVNYSSAEFTLEDGAIRVGLQGLKNLGKVGAEVAAKRTAPWANMESFMWDLVDVLDKRSVEAMAYAGALDSFGIKRKTLVENSENIAAYLQKVRKFNELNFTESGDELPAVPEVDEIYMAHIRPELSKYEDEFERDEFFQHELEYCGMYVSGHPLDGMDEFYINKDIVSLNQIMPQEKNEDSADDEDENVETVSAYHGRTVNVLGICREVKTIMTKKGDVMYNILLEDATNKMGITVFPKQALALTKADPFFFKKIKDKVIMANGKINTDGYGTKMVAWSVTIVTETLTEDICPEVWVEVVDKEAMARAEEILSDMRTVSKDSGTRVVFYYDLPKASKAISRGHYDIRFTDFLRLKSDFKVTANCELSKIDDKNVVVEDWKTLVIN